MKLDEIKTKVKLFLQNKRDIIEFIATISSISSAASIILVVAKIITISATWIIPFPVLLIICYCLLKFIPIGYEKIKAMVQEHVTDESQLNELKSIIDDKVSTLHEPTNTTTARTSHTVYVDNHLNEYVRRN